MKLTALLRSLLDSLRKKRPSEVEMEWKEMAAKKRPSEVAQSVKEAMGRYASLFRRLALSEAIDRVPLETNRAPSILDDWFLDGKE